MSVATPARQVSFRSPLRYPGGKQRAISQIAKMFPARAGEYREPMVGGGSVYMYARGREFASRYWINDQFEELIAFWRMAQDEASCRRLVTELMSLRAKLKNPAQAKEYFLKARNENPKDAYRAAFLFFLFNRITFSGTTRAGGFSSAASHSRFTVSSIERLKNMPAALSDTTITNQDFEQVISEPGSDVFIFLYPPYYQASRLYGRGGSLHNFDHDRLAATLRQTPHRFLITYDDCSEIRALYDFARIRPFRLQYGMNNCSSDNVSKIGSELFICNY